MVSFAWQTFSEEPANFQTGFKFLTHVESDLESLLSGQHVFTPAYTI